jgi:soluble lytic murein transglycosylase
MNQPLRPLTGGLALALALALLTALSSDALALARHRQVQHAKKADERHAAVKKGRHAAHVAAARRKSGKSAPSKDTPAPAATAAPLSGDLAAVRQAIDLARKSKTGEATAIEKTIADPAAQKLVEWFILRHPDGDANFNRYAVFIADNPNWPSMGLFRRRAEVRLWQERSDAATVRRFTAGQPASAKGRFALARVLLAEGDRDGAARHVREAWRSEELSERAEAEALETFRDLLTRDDHRARMDKRIGAKDLSGASRAARRLADDDASIVKACAAVTANATKALELLDAVATEARQDLGYTLCRIHWMLRHDRIDDATRLMLAAASETMALQDTDEWWRERRVLARKLLDLGKFQAAYQVVRDAALPANEYYRADFHFMSGWIALRYLNDPAMARAHFAHIDDGASNPISALSELSCGHRCRPSRVAFPQLWMNSCAPPICSMRSASATSSCIS